MSQTLFVMYSNDIWSAQFFPVYMTKRGRLTILPPLSLIIKRGNVQLLIRLRDYQLLDKRGSIPHLILLNFIIIQHKLHTQSHTQLEVL